MTYFAFLARFLGIPLIILAILTWRDARQGRRLPAPLYTWPPGFVILAHVIVAVLYTTPWDNYLVATRVWWYDPALVNGLVIGWVPIEEYTFFVLQTIMTGLIWLFLAKRLVADTDVMRPVDQRPGLRYGITGLLLVIWPAAVGILAAGWRPGTYLGLELAWALPPIMLQTAFGADIIWRYRRLVFWSLVPVTIYLCLGDAVAIGAGTWSIDPAQSTGILIGNLPLEEIVFFFITNILVVLGMTLVLARGSQQRAPAGVTQWIARLVRQFRHKAVNVAGDQP
ncbi:MAG: lycopene cyclase domain-containing protein [Caldilineaceae bacterium]|nr:lycopene cyclase domain-containing protein [Caldilineaceae bacterium]